MVSIRATSSGQQGGLGKVGIGSRVSWRGAKGWCGRSGVECGWGGEGKGEGGGGQGEGGQVAFKSCWGVVSEVTAQAPKSPLFCGSCFYSLPGHMGCECLRVGPGVLPCRLLAPHQSYWRDLRTSAMSGKR